MWARPAIVRSGQQQLVRELSRTRSMRVNPQISRFKYEWYDVPTRYPADSSDIPSSSRMYPFLESRPVEPSQKVDG